MNFVPSLRHQHPLAEPRALALQDRQDFFEDALAGLFRVNEIDAPAEDLGGRVTEEHLGAAVPQGDAALRVDRDDGHGGILNQGPVPGLADGQAVAVGPLEFHDEQEEPQGRDERYQQVPHLGRVRDEPGPFQDPALAQEDGQAQNGRQEKPGRPREPPQAHQNHQKPRRQKQDRQAVHRRDEPVVDHAGASRRARAARQITQKSQAAATM